MKKALFVVLPLAFLAGCAGGNEARYLISSAPSERVANLQSRSIEVRLVTLPGYAASSEIMVERSSGALFSVGDGEWADDPARGMTAALAKAIYDQSGATAAVEPWPLNSYPDARLDVRVDEAFANAGGEFVLSGQFAVSSPDDRVREFVDRFSITVPVVGEGATGISDALSAALSALARQIVLAL